MKAGVAGERKTNKEERNTLQEYFQQTSIKERINSFTKEVYFREPGRIQGNLAYGHEP